MFGSEEANKSVKPNCRRRVLKPPGGGSSDIFGTTAEPAEPQRKIRNHLTSSIFTGDTVTPSKTKSGNDSFYNLFGSEPRVGPVSIFKDKTKSNIFHTESTINDCGSTVTAKRYLDLTEEDFISEAELNSCKNVDIHEVLAVNGSNCDVHQDVNTATDNNSHAVNGAQSSSNSVVSDPAPAPAPVSAPTSASASAPAPAPSAGKQRVPPGGFSSGLW